MGFLTRLVVRCLPYVPRFLVQRVARRYVAGSDLPDAVRTVQQLNAAGVCGTVALLGESIAEAGPARQAAERYGGILDALHGAGVQSHISIKPTLLGLDLGEDICAENMDLVFAAARATGTLVRIDMENRQYTDATLRLFRTMQARHGNAGVVLQAHLRRTLADIDQLPAEGLNVRLCKGIYVQPREVAWQDRDTVRAAFLHALEKLLARGAYVGIATHDEALVCGAMGLIDRYHLSPERHEFQMLLGVDERLRHILVDGGHRVRVYVPFGKDWYAYSTRRLRESPQVARAIIRAFFGLR